MTGKTPRDLRLIFDLHCGKLVGQYLQEIIPADDG